ncbi:MAG TPA: 4-hydroxybenzoate octaprenyltransferase [Candidatus Competibacteraceae bacterium]|nr:4-hydroxybenzoate octaprenyltransferase [Candidatus Competibacteraceae bacterium]HRZ06773.1 4-hydroxybenzoate octaprenyltransferase [Candidatus Competibacteraceae bacterium]HSA47537.1 4-hydroxybenzoate octaprenyltransferase [Candidatus Competibacteraceae bacterium]
MNIDRFDDRLREYALLMRLHRPIGIYLLLWPTLWALWLAGQGQPPQGVTLIFVLGVVLMRSAGCVMNDIADRDFDPNVARTRDRPLAARRVTLYEALSVATLLALLAFLLVLTQNALTIQLSFIGLALAASYPLMKRLHSLPQVYLGAAFGWGIPMAYAAVSNELPLMAWLLFLANILWSVIYDTQYAMVDREDDLKVGVKSTAILFGKRDRQIIGYLQLALLALLALIGLLSGRGAIYYLGLFIAAWLALYQQYLIRNRQPEGCFKAFLNNNAFGMAVFCGLLVDFLPAGST